MKGIMSGSVSVKENDKSIDQITDLLSSLDSFIERKNNVASKIKDLENKLLIFNVAKLDDLEKSLDKANLDKEDSESKISTLKSDMENDKRTIDRLTSDIEESLSQIMGTKYEIQV